MSEDQFNKLIDYIEAAVRDGVSGAEGLHEHIIMIEKRKELHDSFFKAQEEENEIN